MGKNCCLEEKNKELVFAENNKKLILINENREQYIKCIVDGCLIKGKSKRCDFLVKVKNEEVYIELKGNKIEHGIKQLEESIKQLGRNTAVKRSYLICSRVPAIGANIQNMVKLHKKKCNSILKIRSNSFKDKLVSL